MQCLIILITIVYYGDPVSIKRCTPVVVTYLIDSCVFKLGVILFNISWSQGSVLVSVLFTLYMLFFYKVILENNAYSLIPVWMILL